MKGDSGTVRNESSQCLEEKEAPKPSLGERTAESIRASEELFKKSKQKIQRIESKGARRNESQNEEGSSSQMSPEDQKKPTTVLQKDKQNSKKLQSKPMSLLLYSNQL